MASAVPDLELALRDVSVKFGSRDVFGRVSMSVTAGGVTAVTGANGSGKSTLLRTICGLLTPQSGSVELTLHGHATAPYELRRRIGLVAPDLGLYRSLSAAEHLRLSAQMRGVDGSVDRLRALLTMVGLRGRGRDLVGAYSTGMRHRLRYALALIHEPPVLILDEPTANLDADGAAIVKSIVERQRGFGAVVIATNDAAETAWADDVLALGSQRT